MCGIFWGIMIYEGGKVTFNMIYYGEFWFEAIIMPALVITAFVYMIRQWKTDKAIINETPK